MKRKYLSKLVEWKNDPSRKPLVVWGARQVGKSYLIEELFAKQYYPGKFLKIDCSEESEFVEYVYKYNNLEKTIEFLKLRFNFVDDGSHLLFFDEAQECLPLLKMLKHFCEKRRELPVILSGSYVRLKLRRQGDKRFKENKNGFLFPVGKINSLTVYPMTFDEFVMNLNPQSYDSLRQAYSNRSIYDVSMHEYYLSLLEDYLFVGGMPEVVDTYISSLPNKIDALSKAKIKLHEIYDDYLADMQLYQVSSASIVKSRSIYGSLFSQLNKENKNFKPGQSVDGASNRDLLEPLFWLETANVVYRSVLLDEKVAVPLIRKDSSMFRLYLADMGIFTQQSGTTIPTFVTSDNALSGIFYENYMAIEMVSRGIDLFYWKGKRNCEMEFIMDVSGKIVPVDVKKSHGKMASLDGFRLHNKKDLAVKVSKNRYGYNVEKSLLTMPFYFVPFFLDDVASGATVDAFKKPLAELKN